MKISMALTLLVSLAACGGCGKSNSPDPTPSPSPSSGWVQTPPFVDGATVDGPLPNILSVGDSISGGYVSFLYDRLKDQYDVHHSTDNDRNSFYTMTNWQSWTWPNDNIIVWNNGIWDCALQSWHDQYVPLEPIAYYGTTLAEYQANIIATATAMKATGARVIFLTTTDIPSQAWPFDLSGKENQLNTIAKTVLPPLGVEVYDLHDFALAIPNAHPNVSDVHFNPNANYLMAWYIAQAIAGNLVPVQ